MSRFFAFLKALFTVKKAKASVSEARYHYGFDSEGNLVRKPVPKAAYGYWYEGTDKKGRRVQGFRTYDPKPFRVPKA